MGSCGSQEVSIHLGEEAIPSCSAVKENNTAILFYSESLVSSYQGLLRELPSSIISKITRYYSPSLSKSVLFIHAISPKTFVSDISLTLEICQDSVLVQISATKIIKLLLPEDKEIELIFKSNRPMKLKYFVEFIVNLKDLPTIKEVLNYLKKTIS